MIDTHELDAAIRDSLYKEDELDDPQTPPEEAIIVEGIATKFGFHPERLETHRDQVHDWLAQLPHGFRKEEGGGWSFLQACDLEDGTQWTGLHRDMEALFCLGMGLGYVKPGMPRELWSILPGGMPYYVIDLEGFE